MYASNYPSTKNFSLPSGSLPKSSRIIYRTNMPVAFVMPPMHSNARCPTSTTISRNHDASGMPWDPGTGIIPSFAAPATARPGPFSQPVLRCASRLDSAAVRSHHRGGAVTSVRVSTGPDCPACPGAGGSGASAALRRRRIPYTLQARPAGRYSAVIVRAARCSKEFNSS